MQWRRQDFLRGGGTPGHLKAITLPPQRVRRRSSRMVMKLKIFKRLKILENESIFSKKNFKKIEDFLKNYFKNFKISFFGLIP